MWKEEYWYLREYWYYFQGIEKPQTARGSENQGCEEACGKCTGLRNEMLVLSGVSMQ
jgi:hypothetical protein